LNIVPVGAYLSHRQPRYIREFAKWAQSCAGNFAEDVDETQPYWNAKLPMPWQAVEGRFAKLRTRKACAQIQLAICAEWIAAKPSHAKGWSVTCVICIPDFWTSELCIYLSDEYAKRHYILLSNEEAQTEGAGKSNIIVGRPLADAWRLNVPNGMRERGVQIDYFEADEHHGYQSEHWYYGELT
jgi:Protein of unknown function (DUF3916)